MSEVSEEIAVPQMVGLDALTKIIMAFLKAGGDQKEVPIDEVAQVAGVSPANISLNNRFFVSMGLLEGKRRSYKLTPNGAEYAKALDWGRLEEAQILLKKTIKDKTLVQRTTSYVDLNKPVSKDDLISRVASIANVPNKPRFSTGIKAFIEMLILSGILTEEKDGKVFSGPRDDSKEKVFSEIEPETKSENVKSPQIVSPMALPFTLSINIDNSTDPEKLKSIIKAIREAIADSS